MAMRGRNPADPSDRKTHSNGTFVQRAELGGGYFQHPDIGSERQLCS